MSKYQDKICVIVRLKFENGYVIEEEGEIRFGEYPDKGVYNKCLKLFSSDYDYDKPAISSYNSDIIVMEEAILHKTLGWVLPDEPINYRIDVKREYGNRFPASLMKCDKCQAVFIHNPKIVNVIKRSFENYFEDCYCGKTITNKL